MYNYTKLMISLSWIFLLSTAGISQPAIDWEKNLGGSSYDAAQSVIEDTDGGLVIAGTSESLDNDVSENFGGLDIWIVKLDATGNLVWEKSYGGGGSESAATIQKTNDGGFIVAGYTNSTDGDVNGTVLGNDDAWLLKLDEDGNLEWEQNYGGIGDFFEGAVSVKQTGDGGYVALIQADSNDGDVGGNNGLTDYWLIKIDATGNLIWEQNYGGSGYDTPNDIIVTSDDEIILSGHSLSTDGDLTGIIEDQGFWVLKLDSEGNIIWNQAYESGLTVPGIAATSDGGFILAGGAGIAAGDVGGNNGSFDFWVVKIDGAGNLIWEQNYGGTKSDRARAIRETNNGTYVVGGLSKSSNVDASSNFGGDDFWMLEIDATGNIIWEQNYGGAENDRFTDLIVTSNGGIVAVGMTGSSDEDVSANYGDFDYWVLKLVGNPSSTSSIVDPMLSQIYPNPSNGNFSILLENDFQEKEIEIIDVLGNIIYSTKSNASQIDIDHFPNGTFIVNVYLKTGVERKSIVVDGRR